MAKTAIPEAAGRSDIFRVYPEMLTLITDKASLFYDHRIELPVSEELISTLIVEGQLDVILVRRAGKREDGTNIIEVLNGTQRTRAFVEINKRRAEVGQDPVTVMVRVANAPEERQVISIRLASNNAHVPTPPSMLAKQFRNLLDSKGSLEDAARTTFRSVGECKALAALAGLCDDVLAKVDDGTISISAASKFLDLGTEGQRKLLREMVSSGEKITASRVAEKSKKSDGGIQAPKAKRMMTRIQIAKLRDNSTHDEMSEHDRGFVAALNMVLGEDNGE